MSFASVFYNSIFRQNATFLATVFGAGLVWEVGYNRGMNSLWDSFNRGRQWKDIRSRYLEGAEEDEE